MLASSSTCSVDSRIRQLYLLSWIRDWTGVKLRTTVKKQILCTSLPVDTELIVTPMIHGSTFEFHKSFLIVFGVCEGHDMVEAVSED